MPKHPTPEELGEPDVKAGAVQIWVHGRQFPGSTDYYDGNWLRITAHCGALGASVWASGAILMTTDLAGWAHDCDALAEGDTQTADLEPLEPELHIRIRRIDRLGHFAMRVKITPDHLHQKHSFEFEIDRTDLREIARRCRSIIEAYPVKGGPLSKMSMVRTSTAILKEVWRRVSWLAAR